VHLTAGKEVRVLFPSMKQIFIFPIPNQILFILSKKATNPQIKYSWIRGFKKLKISD